MKLTPQQVAARKAVATRSARREMKNKYPVGYAVATLRIRDGLTASEIAQSLHITEYQARGYLTRVTRGEFASCNL